MNTINLIAAREAYGTARFEASGDKVCVFISEDLCRLFVGLELTPGCAQAFAEALEAAAQVCMEGGAA